MKLAQGVEMAVFCLVQRSLGVEHIQKIEAPLQVALVDFPVGGFRLGDDLRLQRLHFGFDGAVPSISFGQGRLHCDSYGLLFLLGFR